MIYELITKALIENNSRVLSVIPKVLFTEVEKDPNGGINHYFITQSDGTTTGKTPKGMFDELKVPNDINQVIETINKYYE